MGAYLLVHGGWHGAWCWQRIVPLLLQAGPHVIAPDLPGHGDDATPIAAVAPGSDVECVVNVLDSLAEPAILVGHSSGGMVISAAAELRPHAAWSLRLLAIGTHDDERLYVGRQAGGLLRFQAEPHSWRTRSGTVSTLVIWRVQPASGHVVRAPTYADVEWSVSWHVCRRARATAAGPRRARRGDGHGGIVGVWRARTLERR